MDFDASNSVAVLPLAALADAVRAALADVYAHPIVVADGEQGVARVLGGKPLTIARDAIAASHGDAAAARIVTLDMAALPWHAVPAGGLRLWRQHGRAGAAGELVTELEAGDPPVQRIVSEDGWQLVRLADGAQGWLAPDAGALEGPVSAPPADLADATRVDVERFVETVLGFAGTPYVWGGTTDAGVDCSGIVQRAAWRAGRSWLPRHSRALLRAGRRVPPAQLGRGDLLVLQRDPATYEAEQRAHMEAVARAEQETGAVPVTGPAIHPMHVAVALSADEVVHASRDAMGVVREPLKSLRARYRVLGVRRLGPKETA